MYDYLIVGAGLYGSVCAYLLTQAGKRVLVVEERNHIGGNIYTECVDGITVHRYGAHIFRTSDEKIWEFVNRFAEFKNFINSPIANFNGELYNLPFNMNTFHELWGVNTPDEARLKIKSQCVPCENPANLEEFALSVAGKDIYEKLIKGYTEKQWNKSCKELPASILKRVPMRFVYDNNYSAGAKYQGIPVGGYTKICEALLENSDCIFGIDGDDLIRNNPNIAHAIIHTGCIDKFYHYLLGKLEYRSLKFTETILPIENYQGVAVMNYTDSSTPYTRIIEHKHFDDADTDFTVITTEFPSTDGYPCYPVADFHNESLHTKYEELNLEKNPHIFFAGRLGSYHYADMDKTIGAAHNLVSKILL